MPAQIQPHNWYENTKSTERAFGEFLQSELPNEWVIFPNFVWRGDTKSKRAFGEVDFLILTSKGWLHCIEHKDNPFSEQRDGAIWFKYRNNLKPTNLVHQIKLNEHEIVKALKNAEIINLRTQIWAVLPSSNVEGSIVGLPSSSIFDNKRMPNAMVAFAREIIELDQNTSNRQAIVPREYINKFAQALELAPSTSNFSRRERDYMSRSSDLFRIVNGIKVGEPIGNGKAPAIVLDGVAGCGKTQIGLQILIDAVSKGQEVAVATRTKALAASIANEIGAAHNGKGLWFLDKTHNGRACIGTVQAINQYLQFRNEYVSHFIVEESHSIDPNDLKELLSNHHMRMSPRYILMTDSGQDVAQKMDLLISPVTIELNLTFRCPISITEFLNSLKVRQEIIQTNNPTNGFCEIQHNFKTQQEATLLCVSTIQEMLKCGEIPINSVAVLTGRSLKSLPDLKLLLPNFATLDDSSWQELPVVDTVERFQGFSRPLIMLVDVTQNLEKLPRQLYLAATRATDSFVVFMSCESYGNIDRYLKTKS